jgi:formate hydrogenlyase subunit 6/NADH:ubiquinone oxidoreductase subunit I
MPTITREEMLQIEIVIDFDKCTGCATCVEVCPVDVLEMQTVEKKKKSVALDQSFCLKCHMCEFHCGYQAIHVYPPFEGQQPTDQATIPMRHRHDHDPKDAHDHDHEHGQHDHAHDHEDGQGPHSH